MTISIDLKLKSLIWLIVCLQSKRNVLARSKMYATKWMSKIKWSVKRADRMLMKCVSDITKWIQMFAMSSNAKTKLFSLSILIWRRRSEVSMAGSGKKRWLELSKR